jgi:hypothetical protein
VRMRNGTTEEDGGFGEPRGARSRGTAGELVTMMRGEEALRSLLSSHPRSAGNDCFREFLVSSG